MVGMGERERGLIVGTGCTPQVEWRDACSTEMEGQDGPVSVCDVQQRTLMGSTAFSFQNRQDS